MTYYMSVYLYHVVSIENLMKAHRICDVEYEAWQKEWGHSAEVAQALEKPPDVVNVYSGF